MQKSGILAQPVIERFKRHRWTLGAGGALVIVGMATAVAVAPINNDGALNLSTQIENLALPANRPLDTGTALFMHEERIQRGDTVGALLSRLSVQDLQAAHFIRTSPSTQAIHRQMAPGKTVVALTTTDGELRQLIFPLNGNRDTALVVERKGDTFAASEQALRYETQTVMKSAEIRFSLFGATDAAEIPDAIATQLADIFGGDIDFHRDLRKGDRFSVVYEMNFLRGQPARSGKVLSAEFINNGKILRAVYFETDGKGGYYTPDGKSLRKAFLRSPLEFSRVTSGFAMRMHPILQEWRAHKGVDYAAPTGTRVRSTGDGLVEFVGRQGGYGNMIVVRHQGNYATAYGHLSAFAPGIKKGARISQGETIGFVGATGWATGPHLHYEFRINNQQVDPLSVALPTAVPIEPAQLPRFLAAARAQLDRINLVREIRLVAME